MERVYKSHKQQTLRKEPFRSQWPVEVGVRIWTKMSKRNDKPKQKSGMNVIWYAIKWKCIYKRIRIIKHCIIHVHTVHIHSKNLRTIRVKRTVLMIKIYINVIHSWTSNMHCSLHGFAKLFSAVCCVCVAFVCVCPHNILFCLLIDINIVIWKNKMRAMHFIALATYICSQKYARRLFLSLFTRTALILTNRIWILTVYIFQICVVIIINNIIIFIRCCQRRRRRRPFFFIYMYFFSFFLLSCYCCYKDARSSLYMYYNINNK